MKLKCAFLIIIAAVLIAISAVVSGCGGGSAGSATGDVSKTGNSQVLPVRTNPIKNSSQAPGLVIASSLVENNFDPQTKKNIPDCLQIELKNNGSQAMSNLEIFYKMTDAATGASESYYQKLNGLTLNAGESRTIFFDNGTEAGHYPENKYSIYRTSKNEVDFSIEVSAAGFKPATTEAKKAAGTGEQQD